MVIDINPITLLCKKTEHKDISKTLSYAPVLDDMVTEAVKILGRGQGECQYRLIGKKGSSHLIFWRDAR